MYRDFTRLFKLVCTLSILSVIQLNAENVMVSEKRSEIFTLKTEQTADCIAVYGTSDVTQAQYDRVYKSVKSVLTKINVAIKQGLLNAEVKILIAESESKVEEDIAVFMKELPAEIVYINEDGVDESLPSSSGAGVPTTELELMYLLVYYSLLTEPGLSAEYQKLKDGYAEAASAGIFIPGESYQDGAVDPVHQNASAKNALKYGSYLFGAYRLYFGDGSGRPGEFSITTKAQLARRNPKGYQFIRDYITKINHAPSFTPGNRIIKVEKNSGFYQQIWATAISDAPGENHKLTFDVATGNSALFKQLPAIDSKTGDLSFSISDNRTGYAKVKVTLSDDGGTADGGDDTSDVEHFIIIAGSFLDENVLADHSPAGLQLLKAGLSDLGMTSLQDDNLLRYSKFIGENRDCLFDLSSMQKVINAVNEGNGIWFYELHPGWNIIHSPIADPAGLDTIFNADFTGKSYHWNTQNKKYVSEDRLSAGIGVWVFWDKRTAIKAFVKGRSKPLSPESLNSGWNLVGLSKDTLTRSKRVMSVWGWDNEKSAYTLLKDISEIRESKGYWIHSEN